MKKVPDWLTGSRGIIAVVISFLGLVGPQALEAVILLIILGWTTDILDGRLARRYHKGATWIGEREFVFDMVMVFSGLCYLVMAGFIPLVPAAIYVAVAFVFIAYFRSKSVTMSFAFPLVALPLIVAYFKASRAAICFVVWICLAALFDWRRFKGVVLEFIENTKALLTKR
ncbi:TPA: hypothetical protein DIT45_05545 [Candidatus Acetothermia bacterium]|nr:hypothetical protein [Candidatus Acetothermia bacterium]